MVDTIFNGNDYHTPEGVPQPLLVRLLGWSRIPFYRYVYHEIRTAKQESDQGLFDDSRFIAHSAGIIRAVERCGGTVSISGMEHIASVSGPVVLIANHMSFLETFALPGMILRRRRFSFVVKESLITNRWVGAFLATLHPIAVGRTNPRADLRVLLEEGKDRISSGQSVCVFPQSTRTPTFEGAKFNSIGTKLAYRAGCPVIPIALRTDFMANGRFLKDFGPVYPDRPVHFAFGAPIDASDPRKAQQAVVDFVVSHLSEWGVPCH